MTVEERHICKSKKEEEGEEEERQKGEQCSALSYYPPLHPKSALSCWDFTTTTAIH